MKKEILRELADALIEILDEEEANEYNKIIECEIQKAREEERGRILKLLKDYDGFEMARTREKIKNSDHSELDQDNK